VRDENAQQLLATVMGWQDDAVVRARVPPLQLLAEHKYNSYQQFGPGKRFIENLALWLNQFDAADRPAALELVERHLVFFSDAEMSHLVEMAYPDVIEPARIRLVADEQQVPPHRIGMLRRERRFVELGLKSLYLGLSDGARTNEVRRGSNGRIGNEQIWQAYELSPEKTTDMTDALGTSLEANGFAAKVPRFNLIWLLDDFSGSGNTYIRYDASTRKYKGKIKKIYEQLDRGLLVDTTHYEVFLLLYVATRQAIEHIEYWAERFTSEHNYKPLQVRVLCPIEHDAAVTSQASGQLLALLDNARYVDQSVVDAHFRVGGTDDARFGFARCALPLALAHNTPNNSLYVLWGPENKSFFGLFPRVSRHREF